MWAMCVARTGLVGLAMGFTAMAPAQAGLLCTIVADAADGKVLVKDGEGCGERVTPASTFKVALAAMGYDSGVLEDADNPVLPFKPGYPDWREVWKQPTGPAGWMRESVVWYSQRITEKLGAQRLSGYARSFGYGNADFSGDPGKGNGLERAWIGSSLKISPREQIAFLRRLVRGELPVTREAVRSTMAIVERRSVDGWAIRGKTGSAFPRRADGSFDRARGWGWYIGWAERDDATFVFAHLIQDERRTKGPGGLRARDELLAAWPSLARRATAGEQ